MIVSRYSNSSVCATNIQTEAKMENAIYKYHYCLHLGADSLDKSLLFKECIVLIFNWQIVDTCLYNIGEENVF